MFVVPCHWRKLMQNLFVWKESVVERQFEDVLWVRVPSAFTAARIFDEVNHNRHGTVWKHCIAGNLEANNSNVNCIWSTLFSSLSSCLYLSYGHYWMMSLLSSLLLSSLSLSSLLLATFSSWPELQPAKVFRVLVQNYSMYNYIIYNKILFFLSKNIYKSITCLVGWTKCIFLVRNSCLIVLSWYISLLKTLTEGHQGLLDWKESC